MRLYQWYLIRDELGINIVDLINKKGYGPCEYKDDKIVLHVQWAEQKPNDEWEPAFAPSRKGYTHKIIDCSCDYVLLHLNAVLVIVEPYMDGTLVIKQFDENKNELQSV